MPTVTQTLDLDPDIAARLFEARDDVVTEQADGDGAFSAAGGPFRSYRREISSTELPDGRCRVAETTRFRLAIPFWGVAFVPPYRREIRRITNRDRRRHPWWAPPDQVDPRAASILALLCSVAVVAGYLGTIITQTVTFAADEFGSSKTAQSSTLAAVRVGVLLSLFLVARADRIGRRRLLLGSSIGACLSAGAGALAPNLVVLGTTQAVSRGLTATVTLLLAIIAAEEMPAGSRAYAISVMTMTGALGAGMALWALPLADTGPRGWRALYIIALLGLPVITVAGRHLPESRRFLAPHAARVTLRGHLRRLVILSATFFLISSFGAPASQLLNDFLRDERGFSASRISLFTVLTSTPAGLAIVVGGRVADERGRRNLVIISVLFGSIATTLAFASHGWPMWAWNLAGTMVAALAVPALGVYGPELFPTGMRGRANGVIQLVSVTGSALGLVLAGYVADRTGSLSHSMTLLLIGPIVVAFLVWLTYPETAHRELEELNPEDAAPPVAPHLPPILP